MRKSVSPRSRRGSFVPRLTDRVGVEPLENRLLLSTTTSTALLPAVTTSVFGQTLTLTATVSARTGKPTGSVSFRNGATVLGSATLNASDKAVFSTKTLPVGSLNLTAVYAGTSAFAGSTSPAVKETVGKDSTRIALVQTPASSVVGQSVSFEATVVANSPGSGTPTGTVTFVAGWKTLGTVTLSSSGTATISSSTLAVGSNKITATYNGSADFTSTTTSITQTISADTTKTVVSLSSTSTLLGQGSTISAAVTDLAPGAGTPTGSVIFYDGKTVIATVAVDKTGHASTTDPLAFTGTHSITASYQGSSVSKASVSSADTWTVKMPTTTKASDGLQSATVVTGSGATAVDGDYLSVNYIGYLTSGTIFDTSLASGRTPFGVTLGAGQVIQGWDQGLVGMKAGETRVLVIPPALGYGSTAQSTIPANSTLIFVVSLLSIAEPQILVFGGTSQNIPITNGESPESANGTLFSSVAVGKSGSQIVFEIAAGNNASVSLTGNPAIQVTGADAADFALQGPVNSNGALLFAITFSPHAKGLRTAKITIPNNDPSAADFSFTVEGTGT